MNKVFIIAEAGINHNGKLELAFELCRKAKDANADAIKFQTFITENLLTRTIGMAEYQQQNVGGDKTQFEMAKELELSFDDFRKIKKYCDEIGLLFLSTPDEEESLDFLVSLEMKLIKVGSSEITNVPYLRKIGSKKTDVILSTGMATMDEVKCAYTLLTDSGAKSVALLHCTSDYPCPYSDVNLKAMLMLKNTFNTKVGYSDHTQGIEISLAAVALGAEIIEKHFTLDRNLPGPDHKASINPGELSLLVTNIRHIEMALQGDGVKNPTTAEQKIKRLVRKNIVARREIKKGDILNEQNCTTKRSSNGVPANKWDLVMGSIAEKDYSIDETINFYQEVQE